MAQEDLITDSRVIANHVSSKVKTSIEKIVMKASFWKAALFLLTITSSTLSAAERPNIVFIMADDLGYGDLGCYGCPDIRTPNIDRLAREGVRMTDFYANACICTPTRYALMTGRYQQRGGMEWALFYQETAAGLPPGGMTIAHLLRNRGYATAISGKWHLGYDDDRAPNHQGFEHFFGLRGGSVNYFKHFDKKGIHDLYHNEQSVEMEGYITDLISDYAVSFLQELHDEPFFLYVSPNAPHFPFQGPADADKPVLPGGKGWHDGTRETYRAMVAGLDRGIGRILVELDKLDLTDKTLVVFTSDNGGSDYARNYPFSKGKDMLWEGGIRVPCIARLPGVLPAGKTSHQVGITMDWTRTMLQLAGAQPPSDKPLDGIDLLPILSGERTNMSRTLYWRRVKEPIRKHAQRHRAVRDGHWKYIDRPDGRQYLYDLNVDPAETSNLAERQPKFALDMKNLLNGWEAGLENPANPNE